MKYLALIIALFCIFLFILQNIIPGLTDALVLNNKALSEPWRFLSAIFIHGSLAHLVSNLFMLILFGLILESIIRSNKFLLIFLLSGIIANLLAFNFYPSSLGASGAIFGIIGCLVILRPLMTVWAFSLPMPLFIAALLWAVGDLLGVFFPDNIGHLAHLSGLFIGLVFGIYFRARYPKKRKRKLKIRIPESRFRAWEDKWMSKS